MENLTYTLGKIQAFSFAVLGLGAIYGAIAKGAYWHIGTAVICAVMAVALLNDARKEAGK